MKTGGLDIYYEAQKFTNPLINAIVIASAALPSILFGYAAFGQIVSGVPMGNKPISNGALIISFGASILFGVAIIYLYSACKLEIRLTNEAIFVRLYPFMIKYRTIPFNTISHYEIRTYKPISEYGGWGIRHTFGKKGMAYNIAGKIGLQLELTNGKKVLIGTSDPDRLLLTLTSLYNPNNIKSE